MLSIFDGRLCSAVSGLGSKPFGAKKVCNGAAITIAATSVTVAMACGSETDDEISQCNWIGISLTVVLYTMALSL